MSRCKPQALLHLQTQLLAVHFYNHYFQQQAQAGTTQLSTADVRFGLDQPEVYLDAVSKLGIVWPSLQPCHAMNYRITQGLVLDMFFYSEKLACSCPKWCTPIGLRPDSNSATVHGDHVHESSAI